MKFKPLGKRIVVKRDEAEATTASGLIITVNENAKEKPITGIVIRIGDEVAKFQEGAHVLFARFNGSEIKIDGNEYLMMREEDVLGVLDA